MYSLVKKIITTPRTTMREADFTDREFEELGDRLHDAVFGSLKRSLAVRAVDSGSSNAEEWELTALGASYYDLERFGIKFVASPRHADALFVTGPVSRNMADALRRTYRAMPEPKLVVAVGDGAIDGGIFKGSYAIAGAVKDVIPVDIEIPGDPPTPRAIISTMLEVAKQLGKKRA